MIETFNADWLALREGVDHRSRSVELTERLHDWAAATEGSPGDGTAAGPPSQHSRVGIVDLGSGTGSNLRYLSPRLPPGQAWLLVDHDEELLDRASSSPSDLGADGRVVEVGARVMDLLDIGRTEIEGTDLVTASALLDLVSSEWIESLANTCAASRCAALFALTFDGTIAWDGAPVPDDDLLHDAVNEHQRREKGLGAALGPEGGPVAAEAFERRGYQTFTAPSPWQLGPDDGALALALVSGWVGAAVEQRPTEESRIRTWALRRERSIEEGDFALTVGHLDVLALPSLGAALDAER